MDDDPLIYALKLTETNNPEMYNYINDIMNNFDANNDMNTMKEFILNSDRTRFITYAGINHRMDMHEVYAREYKKSFVPEPYRMAFTRMRTSSHKLRVETGRWARLNRNDRLCKCREAVGDEEHALTHCRLTQSLRDTYEETIAFPDILINANSEKEFKYIYDVLKISE